MDYFLNGQAFVVVVVAFVVVVVVAFAVVVVVAVAGGVGA